MNTKLPNYNPQAIAFTVLDQVANNGKNLDCFDPIIKNYTHDNKVRSLTWKLCFETARYYHYYLPIAAEFVNFKKTKKQVVLLIIIGLVQLDRFSSPDHVSIFETVNAAKLLKFSWASKLINAVLRQFQRNKSKSLKYQLSPFSELSLPQWLYDKIKVNYQKDFDKVGHYLLRDADLFLRVNQKKISANEYLKLLQKNNYIDASLQKLSNCIKISRSIKVKNLPFFSDGYFSIQDLSAQYAITLFPIKPNEKILDACAAPGGKTTALLENYSNIQLTALDIDNSRIDRLKENLQRLELYHSNNIKTICANALDIETWWNGELYDHILLDAPCSATGVIRRHPEIKILRSEADIKAICQIQKQLLNCLWKLVKPGGHLLYITCSLLQDENEQQIENFINSNSESNISVQPISIDLPGIKLNYGYQIIPELSDGFYYSLLKKSKN
ncbi:16S rRNA (cytosine(967)-C(5))-methyltransferase RsmB [Thiotrichales bacterium 19S11-10]|nr:16S rRNA (cytosine(967)-C(5))-methyltransferase RsmB [Thiotrichales bacterium 19S11-10]